MASYYTIRRLLIDDTRWYPVTCPIHCATITIENVSAGLAMAIRTDPDDSTTEKRIPALTELEIEASVVTFEPGTQPCWLQLRGGFGNAVVEFTR